MSQRISGFFSLVKPGKNNDRKSTMNNRILSDYRALFSLAPIEIARRQN